MSENPSQSIPSSDEPSSVVFHDAQQAEGDVEATFHQLAEQWKRETAAQSLVSRIVAHPAHQRIIAMGEQAVPLILRDLQKRPHHWFWALSIITHESPIPPEAQGNMRKMADAWLEWGRRKGYIA